MDEQDKFDAIASGMEVMLVLEPILAAVTAYRDRLVQAGFATETAEQMTTEFHHALLRHGFGMK